VRVAVYCRQSVTEGHAEEFGSLQAQREAIEAYCLSQRESGWLALPERYDDAGYSGSSTDRPAFKRLLADIEAGLVDAVGVYKFDRLSRRQIDFLRTLEFFEKHGVSFVSVTQHLDTSTSMGRCMMNIMSAFAQLEREVISERTRDKMLASRRRGMWTGGRPVLGYDVRDRKLVVNEAEAEQVREIFALYQELGGLIPVVEELNRRGCTTKSWTTEDGRRVQGSPFSKTTLHSMLHNVLYLGRVRAGGEVVDGEHEAIVDEETWTKVQHLLRAGASGRSNTGVVRATKSGALLQGLARCRCGSALVPHYSAKGGRRHGYYVCAKAHKQGAASCPGSRVAMGKLEQFVVEQLRTIGRDPALVGATVAAERDAREARRPELVADSRRLRTELGRLEVERKNVVDAVATGGSGRSVLLAKLAELDAQVADVGTRLDVAVRDLTAFESGVIDAAELTEALQDLDAIWAELFPKERARLLALLLESVVFDAQAEEVAITFRPSGPRAVATRSAGGDR